MFSSFWTTLFILGDILGVLFVPVVLIRKKNPVSALAWTLTVIFIPYFGILFFLVFGASRVKRKLRRKIRHRSRFQKEWSAPSPADPPTIEPAWEKIDQYAERVGGTPACLGNHLQLYHDGKQAFQEKYTAIRKAQHHIHLEYFILRNDETGRTLIDLLSQKAREGVKVRLLLDAFGSFGTQKLVRKLQEAGGKTALFLPNKILTRRFTMSLRNHRKILICDGKTAFMGGLNIGDEYLGRVKTFGYWRDTHMKISGPAVHHLQRIFCEDWDFAAHELISSDPHFPEPLLDGSTRLQIVASGPDQEENASHETYFGALISAKKRLWIATPYFVPDSALISALRSAAIRGVDVRILTQSYPPDHYLTYWASRFFWEDLLKIGIRFFEYKKGMMHAKVMIADSAWACVGSSNLDIRSVRLNFEVNCHIHTPLIVQELETQYEEDLRHSRELTYSSFKKRPLRIQLLENICRLFSPLL